MGDYRIRTVAQMTGMTPALLRAWEARYGLVSPERTPAGYRLYSEQDVALFVGAQRMVRQGLAPMQVARLPRNKLLEAGGMSLSAAPSSNRNEQRDSSGESEPQGSRCYPELVDRILSALAQFDTERAQELLAMPLLLMKPAEACRKFLVPLLIEIGERWHRRELSIAVEHFGTALVRNKLIVMLETLRSRNATRRVVCAGPPGELHEVGLLIFAIDAATQGFEPIYLGTNVPLFDLGSATQHVRPELVATSLVYEREPQELQRLLLDMKAAAGPSCPMLVGGRGVHGQEALIRETGCVTLPISGMLVDLLPAGHPHAPAR